MDEDEKAFAAYTTISHQIKKEDKLIHQRVASGLSTNGVIATLVGAGYGIARENLIEPRDFIIAGFVLAALAFVAIWVSYTAIGGIAAARTQNAYIRKVYLKHWRRKIEGNLELPRPYLDRSADQDIDPSKISINVREIKMNAGGAGTLFQAIIAVWMIVLAILLAALVKWLAH